MSSANTGQSTGKAGRIPGYETVFVTKPELSDEGLKALHEKLKGIMSLHKGEFVFSEDWGKRKLAYSIQKETRGHYTYMVYSGQDNVVQEIERNLRISEHVLRFLTVNLAEEFDPEAFKKKRQDHHAYQKRREEEREARRYSYDDDYSKDYSKEFVKPEEEEK